MRLIYFSPIPAESYAQRPHFLVQALCDQGMERVLWVEPYPTRLPQGKDLRGLRGVNAEGTPLDARVEVLSVPALPIEPLPGGWRLNRRLLWGRVWRRLEAFAAGGPTVMGIGKPSALARQALQTLRCATTFYDAMDNFPEFHRGLSRRSVRYFEKAIAAEVDMVLVSSTNLEAKFTGCGAAVERVANAYSMASFPREPQAERATRDGDLVLGYIGCLGPWFDWPLVAELAESMPHAELEIVGPPRAPLPTSLPANVRLHPACRQPEAAQWTSRFSAGLIPFRLNALTSGVDPIKYYEYRAAGLPVLSTRFGEMALRDAGDGVYFLERGCDCADVAVRAAGHRYSAVELEDFRRANDWSRRFGRESRFAGRIFAPSQNRAA